MRNPVAGRVAWRVACQVASRLTSLVAGGVASAASRAAVRTAVLAGALLLGIAGAAPGQAAGEEKGQGEHGVRLAVTVDGRTRSVLLECEPVPHGTHPQAARACAALDVAGGDFDALHGERGICHDAYAPVVATARGQFRGHPVRWRKKFANACIVRVATGPVFAF